MHANAFACNSQSLLQIRNGELRKKKQQHSLQLKQLFMHSLIHIINVVLQYYCCKEFVTQNNEVLASLCLMRLGGKHMGQLTIAVCVG